MACGDCHISTSPHYQLAVRQGRCQHLSVSLRHAQDPEFCRFLDKIRVEEISEEELQAALPPELHISEREVVQQCVQDPATTVLCTHKEDVQAYNKAILQGLQQAGKVDEVFRTPLDTDACDVPELHAWLQQPQHHTLRRVAVGARVMFTHNLDLAQNAANGATGTVTQVATSVSRLSSQQEPSVLHVRMDGSGCTIRVRRSAIYVRYHDGLAYRKCAFPLTLAYAMTGHKCQGATLAGPTIIHATNVFACGLLYVMLSRVTTRANLRIVPTLKASDFKPLKLAPGSALHSAPPPSH